jgi:hypothetical protein
VPGSTRDTPPLRGVTKSAAVDAIVQGNVREIAVSHTSREVPQHPEGLMRGGSVRRLKLFFVRVRGCVTESDPQAGAPHPYIGRENIVRL